MGYGPYVPVSRLNKILEEYMEQWDLTETEVARELAANTGKSEEAWLRRLYSWRSGETDTCRFDLADQVLTGLYLIDRWRTDLNDIYEAA